MAIEKTRAILVDVARRLFARKGLEETTMNDISQAAGKGRRTLYTYFKNKEEIFDAVVEAEMDRLAREMAEVASRLLSPEDKLVAVIYGHLEAIKEVVQRNGNMRAEFFRDESGVARKIRSRLRLCPAALFIGYAAETFLYFKSEFCHVSLQTVFLYYII